MVKLPPEIVALAMHDTQPIHGTIDFEIAASELNEIAASQHLDDWVTIHPMVGIGKSRLSEVRIQHRRTAPPLVVGLVKAAGWLRHGWFAAVNGAPLRHDRTLLFSTAEQAQRAAVMGAAFGGWHRVMSYARAAGEQALELMQLSDQHDAGLLARGIAHLTPRYEASRRALGIDDELIREGLIAGEIDNSSPLRVLVAATADLYGVTRVAEQEFRGENLSLTFRADDYPGVDCTAAVTVIKGVLARVAQMNTPEWQRAQDEKWEKFWAAVAA